MPINENAYLDTLLRKHKLDSAKPHPIINKFWKARLQELNAENPPDKSMRVGSVLRLHLEDHEISASAQGVARRTADGTGYHSAGAYVLPCKRKKVTSCTEQPITLSFCRVVCRVILFMFRDN